MLIMDLEETEARNDCAGEDQQQFNHSTDSLKGQAPRHEHEWNVGGISSSILTLRDEGSSQLCVPTALSLAKESSN
jgi:hypothetical protein